MNPQDVKNCKIFDLAAYVDGELSPREEMDLEMHLAECDACAEKLNEQKKMLCALDFALVEDENEIKLPEDFTKVVVANAESRVGGLRCPKERYRTLFVCAALFLMVLLGLRGDTGQVFATFGNFFEQVWAVGGFLAHLVYDIAIGTTVIFRSVFTQFIHSYSIALFIFAVVVLLFSVYALTRAFYKISPRVKI